MWFNSTWAGLLQWCETDANFRRELLVRRAARRKMSNMLSKERIPDLTTGEFMRRIAARGCVRHADGSLVEAREMRQIAPERLEDLLESGALDVTGNPMLVESETSVQEALPGLADGGSALLRDAIEQLLSRVDGSGGEIGRAIERAGADDGLLTRQLAAHVVSVCSRKPRVIFDRTRVTGLQRLSGLVSGWRRWTGIAGDFERLDLAFEELMSASHGVLSDPLAADLLLCRMAELRELRAWKIAIGLNETRAESEAISRRCLAEGFAAIAPEDPDDPNIGRLESILPGDCVVMHLRGRIGAIGRVTRPYYEIDRRGAGPLDRCWWRRVGVEWVAGDRDYGNLLAGAQQRFSVVELDWGCFRAISAMYRHDPRYDQLFRPLHGSWLIRCDSDRYEALAALDRPLPLRDQWSFTPDAGRPSPGDRILLYHDDRPRGVFGAGTVISASDCVSRHDSGRRRVEVVYDVLRERPAPRRATHEDPRLADWEPPSAQISHLSPDRTAAFCEFLGARSGRHFVLLARGRSGNAVSPHEVYRLQRCGSDVTRQLLASATEGDAHCLIYHARPENAFVGFGRVIEITECEHTEEAESALSRGDAECALEVRIDVCRFARRAGAGSVGADRGLGVMGRGRDEEGLTRTVLPVSQHDFYRVVGAGMTAPAQHDDVLSLEALASASCAPPERLEEMERILRDRGQMIFYGPPGTGKTWLALRLSEYLCGGDESRREIVQFHPAYSYEDFIEGIRPRAVEAPDGSSSVAYPLVRGSFARFCDRARRDELNTHVFVIDEINRAQVAAVFGELMLALEYRGREVRLAHG
ncbi:MAG: AAA family ATPase, partial [Armatimonadota bacterium]